MLDDIRLHKGTQTLASVTPHFLLAKERQKIRVRCTRSVQTEAHLDKDDCIDTVENTLKYTPYISILNDSVCVKNIPKKFRLKFDDKITEEDISEFDENSTWDPSDLAQALTATGKSNLRRGRIMGEMVDEECQTTLMVRPIFLDLDDVAQVYRNLEVQTSRTFTPNASMELVNKELHLFYYHETGSTVNDLETAETKAQEEDKVKEKKPAATKRSLRKKSKEKPSRCLTACPASCNQPQVAVEPPCSPNLAVELLFEVQIDAEKKSIKADDIKDICINCSNEQEVLKQVKCWYTEIGSLLDDDESEGNIDPITGKDLDLIEAQIIANANLTADSLQAKADRMNQRYSQKETQDFEIQCKDLADHKEPGECLGGIGNKRNKSCTCDCQLYAKPDKSDKVENGDFTMCAKKLAEICRLVTGGMLPDDLAGRLGEVISSPALMASADGHQTSSDLANKRAKTELPLNARACTNRKCNCLYSKGCLHCEQALDMMQKKDMNDPSRLKSCKKFTASQNIEFITEVDGEYADAYLEALEQDDAFTQTDENAQDFFGTATAPCIPPPPCSCLTNVEIPWDLLIIPPTPKKRSPPEEVMEALPEVVRAQLKELTVRPITEEQLLALTKEFLTDNIGNLDNIEEIQKQILIERARIDADVAAAAAEQDGEGEGEEDQQEPPYKPCRPRPPLKPFQVFDPECEVLNEPYLDRMMRYFCEEEMEGVGECTSRVEMPWHQIEIAKTIVIRKGRAPCERKIIQKSLLDPHRKCGPEHRKQMRQQQEMFGSNSNSVSGIVSCLSKNSRKRFSNPDLTQSKEDCICKPSKSNSQPEMNLKKLGQKGNDTCICLPDKTDKAAMDTMDGIVSCMKGKGRKKPKGKKGSASLPTIPKNSSSCVCGIKTDSEQPTLQEDVNVGTGVSVQGKSPPQSRTERIAALLDSCKKEMEPIKDGINQLRARIKELNIPDLMAYQEPPQHPGVGGMSAGVGPGPSGMGFMGGPMGMPPMPPMPPMCYPPPMMCYPFPPPCMYPPGGVGVGLGTSRLGPSNLNEQVTRLPPSPDMGTAKSSKKCKCKSKRRRHVSSSYNTSSDTDATATTDYEENRRRSRKRPERSSSRFLCSCKPQESKTVICPSLLSSNAKSSKPASGVALESDQYVEAKTPRNKSSVCVCGSGTASSASKSTKKSCIQSKIPRRTSQSSSKRSGAICPTSSLATEKASAYKSCTSNLSERNDGKSCGESEKSLKSIKSCKTERKMLNDNDVRKNSLMMVESCATQKSQSTFDTCASATAKASNLKSQPAMSTASTSCKIRFSDTIKGKKCAKCESARYRPDKVEAGVEVKRGRPVERSNEELSCQTVSQPF